MSRCFAGEFFPYRKSRRQVPLASAWSIILTLKPAILRCRTHIQGSAFSEPGTLTAGKALDETHVNLETSLIPRLVAQFLTTNERRGSG